MIGLQWHLERMWERDEASWKLISAFVNAAKTLSCR